MPELALWTVVAGFAALAFFVPHFGVLARWDQWRRMRQRARLEDALKFLLTESGSGSFVSAIHLRQHLNLSESALNKLTRRLQRYGLLQTEGGRLRLTPSGELVALRIVRAHRLWESYLADEAGLPLGSVHAMAERLEHSLSSDELDALDAHLGHPAVDPHGDPIPSPGAPLPREEMVPLSAWPVGEPAEVLHLEDEPEVVFRQILALGILPGARIRLLAREPERLIVSHGAHEHRMAPEIAANIHVGGIRSSAAAMPAGAVLLSELDVGETGIVAGIDPRYRGLARRRLLDLGLTPGAEVLVELDNAFGDPRGFRVRGTLIGLRQAQAARIWVQRQTGSADLNPAAETRITP